MKKIVSLVLAVIMLCSVVLLTGCPASNDNNDDGNNTNAPKTYTYKTYTTAFGTNWNPHAWETNADDAVNGYITSPFVTMSIKDSKNGVYQWVYEMATSITDVTAANKGDLTKYPVNLPEGKTANDITEGYVYEIKLNPNAKWQDGTPINADSYIKSMQYLLDPDMKNYRSNLYWSGESAVAGGFEYYYSKDETFYQGVKALGFESNKAAIDAGKALYINVWSFWGAKGYVDADGNACPEWLAITDEVVYSADGKGDDAFSAKELFEGYGAYLEVGADYSSNMGILVQNENLGFSFDKVGCYKVDEYTIRYVNDTYININYFLTSCTSTWLVYEPLYTKGFDTTGELKTTNYGTSLETTISYGPYKLVSYEKGKQMVFEQNENWYGYTKKEDGTLYSETNFLVDGEKRQQYQATKVVIDLIEETATAKQMFLKGELSDWSLEADDLVTYATSDKLYKVDETYTMSFFFNTNVDMLKEMDKSKGNTNSVVLSNTTFRKAMSLAINRAEYVAETAGYKPAFSLMNSLYYYDVYNDPTTSYRNSDEAMQAIVNLYGVEYGPDKTYKTLKEAHDSINGFNLTEAKALMKTACDELVAAGLYTKGQDIKIKIGWAKGALTSADNKQVTVLQNQINAALAGSGFGKITFEAVGSIEDRYGAVPAGEYAIGYGAWGGAAFYPFRNFQVYMDPEQYDLNEAACWDPTTFEMTVKVNGEDVTMTAMEWSRSMMGTGKYATADFKTQLSITAQLEEQYLNFYYRIPLAGTTICSMLSYQVKYYTEDYNIMYDFGGFRLMSFVYDDAAWAEYVASQNGTLNYE